MKLEEALGIIKLLKGEECLYDGTAKKYVDDVVSGDENKVLKRRLKSVFDSGAIGKLKDNGDIKEARFVLKNYTDWDDGLVKNVIDSFCQVLGVSNCNSQKTTDCKTADYKTEINWGKVVVIALGIILCCVAAFFLVKFAINFVIDDFSWTAVIIVVTVLLAALLLISDFNCLDIEDFLIPCCGLPFFVFVFVFVLTRIIQSVSILAEDIWWLFAFLGGLIWGLISGIFRCLSFIVAYGFWVNDEFFIWNLIFYCCLFLAILAGFISNFNDY